jgi:DNA-binding protein HU-beta
MKKNTVHLKEIGADVAKKAGLPKKDMSVLVDALCLGIADALRDGNTVFLPEIGRFVVHHAPERMARNPRTGEPAMVAAHRVVKFRPGLAIKRNMV